MNKIKRKILALVVTITIFLSGTILLTSQQAKAYIPAETCKDNCISSSGHCSWVSGGQTYVCPKTYDIKPE